MDVLEHAKAMVLKLYANVCSKVSNDQLTSLAEAILNANRVFLAGFSRSDMIIRVFANRLAHLGINVNIVGDVTTPKPTAGDLFLISSEFGEIQTLIKMAEHCKKQHITIAVNTVSPFSTLAKLADMKIVLPCVSQNIEENDFMDIFPQSKEYSFELLSFLIYDAVMISLIKKLNNHAQ